MAVRDWTGGQIATAWAALVILSFLAAFAVVGVAEGDLEGLLVVWALIFAVLCVPGLAATWLWFGRRNRD